MRNGFSLIEMLAVIGVMGLSIGLMAPAIGKQLPGLELRAEARKVAHTLEVAEARAVKLRRPVAVTVDLNGPSLFLDGAPALAINPKTTVKVTAALGASEEERPRFVFFPDGTSTGGRIELSRRGHKLSIDTNWLTGNVRTTRPTQAKQV